jgi:hypothetical protein
VQATGASAATVFGDGLSCLGGTFVRLGTQANSAGTSTHPTSGPSLSVRGGITMPGVRHYMTWYRNAASFCTSAAFNVTNALEVIWAN